MASAGPDPMDQNEKQPFLKPKFHSPQRSQHGTVFLIFSQPDVNGRKSPPPETNGSNFSLHREKSPRNRDRPQISSYRRFSSRPPRRSELLLERIIPTPSLKFPKAIPPKKDTPYFARPNRANENRANTTKSVLPHVYGHENGTSKSAAKQTNERRRVPARSVYDNESEKEKKKKKHAHTHARRSNKNEAHVHTHASKKGWKRGGKKRNRKEEKG